MSLYQLKMKSTSNSTAMSDYFYAADDIQDVLDGAEYIRKYGAWFYKFPGVYWSDADAAEMCGLTFNNRLYSNLHDLYVQGNDDTLVSVANGGPEFKVTGSFTTSAGGEGFSVQMSRRTQTPYTSLDYYTDFTISSTIINLGGNIPSGGQDSMGYTYRHFASIPVFKHMVDPTHDYDRIDSDVLYVIHCYCSYSSGDNEIKDKKIEISVYDTLVGYAPLYNNTHVPVTSGGGITTGMYQIFRSFIDTYTKIRSGAETSGNEVYNNPNSPNASAYPAQGYNPDGSRIDLLSPGANGGIGGMGEHESWRDDVSTDFHNALPDYLGGLDTTGDVTETGIIHIYQLTKADMILLSSKLWTNDFLNSLGNSVIDPTQCIISLYKSKVSPVTVGTDSILIGKYDTEITAVTCKQYQKIALPDFFVKRYWDTWLDQNPHTKLCLYLPYVGICEINPDYYEGKYIRIEYYFDFLANLCLVNLYAVDEGVATLVEVKQGDFGGQIPISSARRENIAGSITQMIAGGALTIAGIAAMVTGVGAAAGAGMTAAGAAAGLQAGAGLASAVSGMGQMMSGYNQANKVNYSTASQITAQAALMQSNKVFLFRCLDCVQLPENYSQITGSTAFVGTIVENLKGFSTIKNIRLENVTATETEKVELLNLMQSGIYFP